MGYYTRFSLEASIDGVARKRVEGVDADGNPAVIFVETKLDVPALRKEISDMSGYSDLFEDTVKWYDHEEDMRNFSRSHPNVLFTLSGIGEEPSDMWVLYVKNGKCQRSNAIISYEPFDAGKLK
jgi:hypothetical protein